MLLAFPTILWKLKLLRINLIWKKEKKEEVHISLFGQKIYSLIGTFWLFQEKHLGSKLPSLNYQIIKKRKKKKEKKKGLKYIIRSLSLVSFDFIHSCLKVLIWSLLVWFRLDFGLSVQKTLAYDR